MDFSSFKLSEKLVKAISEQGYTAPTQIQEKAIPLVLEGKDIIGHSQTGSGKTAAFGLPLLNLLSGGEGVRVLILTPTRELCVQVSDALRGFAKYTKLKVVPVYGGVGIGQQIISLRSADVVVATPGRLLDLIERGFKLNTVKHIVLDEADRMLDMGFIDDVEKILRDVPRPRQVLLFSATLSSKLRNLVQRYMTSPVAVQAKLSVDSSLLTEKAFIVPHQDKFSLLVHCIKNETPGIAIVFCATRRNCDKVARKLRTLSIDATAIHGGLVQTKRMHAIDKLHKRGIGILVATDVASRGLHINNISHVYNYDIPKYSDDYVHRIGRTARAGQKGDAVTFVGNQDVRAFKFICRDIGRNIASVELPKFEKVVETAESEGRDREWSDRKPWGRKPERKPFWKNKPWNNAAQGRGDSRDGPRSGGRPPWKKDSHSGGRPPWKKDSRERPSGDRPFRSNSDSRSERPSGDRPFRSNSDSRSERPSGDRPFRSNSDSRSERPSGDRPFRSNSEGQGNRPPWKRGSGSSQDNGRRPWKKKSSFRRERD